MAVIESVYARQILDSRGNPTVEVVLDTDDGAQGLGLVPSGASTGEAEAWERRDGDKSVYQGKGVLNAVKAVNEEIAPKVIGMDASDQRALDETMIELDGTPNKGRLGANAILGVSLAALYASAESADQPLYRYIGGTNGHILPVPNMNIMNGGAHADFATDIQEYMISPYGFNTYSEALQAGVEVYHTLKNVLKKQGLNTGLGDEGGFAPKMKSNKDSLNYIMDAISAAGYEPGKQIGISLDVASSEFYNKETGKYHFEGDDREAGYMLDFYENLINEYPIVSIRIRSRKKAGTTGRPSPPSSAIACSSSATTCWSPTRHVCQGHQARRRQLPAGQAQPDRHRHRDPRRHRAGHQERLHLHGFPPFRRDPGHHHLRPGCGKEHRPDQDRCSGSWRAYRQVQPPARDRGGARLHRSVRRLQRFQGLQEVHRRVSVASAS